MGSNEVAIAVTAPRSSTVNASRSWPPTSSNSAGPTERQRRSRPSTHSDPEVVSRPSSSTVTVTAENSVTSLVKSWWLVRVER